MQHACVDSSSWSHTVFVALTGTRTGRPQALTTPYCMLHIMGRKEMVTTAPDMSCVNTVMDWPAERVFRSWISEGMSQPMGPHPHPKEVE